MVPSGTILCATSAERDLVMNGRFIIDSCGTLMVGNQWAGTEMFGI